VGRAGGDERDRLGRGPHLHLGREARHLRALDAIDAAESDRGQFAPRDGAADRSLGDSKRGRRLTGGELSRFLSWLYNAVLGRQVCAVSDGCLPPARPSQDPVLP